MSACPAPPAAARSGAFSVLSHDQAGAALTLARGGAVSAVAEPPAFDTTRHFSTLFEDFRREGGD